MRARTPFVAGLLSPSTSSTPLWCQAKRRPARRRPHHHLQVLVRIQIGEQHRSPIQLAEDVLPHPGMSWPTPPTRRGSPR